jgi:hypothetical protein
MKTLAKARTATEVLTRISFNIDDAKETFCELLMDTHRNGILNVWEWLVKSSFAEDPASTKFHGACKHGLIKHSLAVYIRMMEIREAIDPERVMCTDAEITIVSLLHDVTKVGVYKTDTRNVKDERGCWQQVPYYKFEDSFPCGHGAKSAIILQRLGLELSENEIKSIVAHSGGWSEPQNIVGGCWKDNPLGPMLHMADIAATYLDEQ